MKYPILASFIIFLIYLSYTLKKNKKEEKNLEENFWERERLANSTRRQPLEDLDYIEIPFDSLPMDALADAPEIQEFHNRLHSLAEKKIVNFTGYSNTDLKLAYGAPNINLLSEYDQNFTDLITLLQSWAAFLLQYPEQKQPAKTILEFAVSIGSDISASYELLIKLYKESGETEKNTSLEEKANELRSLSKGRILSMLKDAETHTPEQCH